MYAIRSYYAERRLAFGKARQRSLGAVGETRAQQRVDDESGVAKPEASVGVRPGVDVVA